MNSPQESRRVSGSEVPPDASHQSMSRKISRPAYIDYYFNNPMPNGTASRHCKYTTKRYVSPSRYHPVAISTPQGGGEGCPSTHEMAKIHSHVGQGCSGAQRPPPSRLRDGEKIGERRGGGPSRSPRVYL